MSSGAPRPPTEDEGAQLLLIARAKQLLRDRMRSVRRVLPEDARKARSVELCQRLVSLPAFAAAKTVVGYVASRYEADPAAALTAADRANKRLGLVRVEQGGALSARHYKPGDELRDNGRGLTEPAETAAPIDELEIDLIIVPALGLDEHGHRLGYGGGYYDRFLPRLPNARSIAIAYDFQLLFEIPSTSDDQRVDCVVTDKRVLELAR